MGFSEPLGKFFVAIGADTSEFRREIERSQKALKKAFGPEALRVSENLTKMVTGMVAGFYALAGAAMKMANDNDKVIQSFAVLTGSIEKAKKLLSEIGAMARANPIPSASLKEAAGVLLNFRVQAEDVVTVLQMLGNVSAITKRPLEDLAMLYGRGFSHGDLTFKDINAFAKQGIPLVDELAKNLKVAKSEIKSMAADGKISAEDMRRAFETMTSAGGQYAGGMDAMAKTVDGKLQLIQSNLKSAMSSWGKELNENSHINQYFDEAVRLAQKFAEDVKKSGAQEAVKGIFNEETRLVIYGIAGAISGAMVPALMKMAIAAAGVASAAGLIYPALIIACDAVIIGHIIDMQQETEKWTKYTRDQEEALRDLGVVGRRELASMSAATMEAELAMMDSVETLEAAIKKIQQTRTSLVSSPAGEPGQAAAAFGANLAGIPDNEIKALQDQITRRRELEAKLAGTKAENSLWGGISKSPFLTKTVNFLLKPSSPFSSDPRPQTNYPESAGSGKGAEKAFADAKRLSESIRREWEKVTLTEREQINLWYQEESQALEASKTANTSYLADKQRLYEIYRNKLNDIDLESAKARNKYREDLVKEEQVLAEQKVRLAEIASEAIRRQIQEENDQAEQIAERLEAIRTGQALEEKLQEDYRRGDLANYIAHLNAKNSAFLAHLQGQQEYMQLYRSLQEEAHRSELSYMAEGYQALYSGLTNAITGVLTGTQNAAQAVKNLGLQMVEMVVRWMVQRKLAAMLSSTMEKTTAAQSVASASVVSAAWAKAAAMVSLATMGANMAPAMASLSSMTAFAQAMAIPGLANGGIVTRPTIAMIGEGKGPEAVIPLDRLGGLAPKVTVNVVNNSGASIDAKPNVTMNGQEMIVSVFIDAIKRNVGGIRTALKGG